MWWIGGGGTRVGDGDDTVGGAFGKRWVLAEQCSAAGCDYMMAVLGPFQKV